MKKMLVKAVALSLVMGGVGFVANNAQAAPFPSETDIMKANIQANSQKIMKNQNDIAGLKGDVATNKANIADNNLAIQKEAAARRSDIAMTNFKAELEKQERENADKKLSERIDAEAKARKDADAMNSFMAGLEKQERENNDKKLEQKN